MAGERKAASAETLSGVSGRARGRVAAVREKRRGEGRREKGRRGKRRLGRSLESCEPSDRIQLPFPKRPLTSTLGIDLGCRQLEKQGVGPGGQHHNPGSSGHAHSARVQTQRVIATFLRETPFTERLWARPGLIHLHLKLFLPDECSTCF